MIGVGLSIVQLAVRQLLGFDPKSLFAASEPGVWYDPSDMSTMFQDSAGTTPVTAVEQPVGLILDKSKGLVLGPELISNAADREFTSDTGWWTKAGSAAIGSGKCTLTTGSSIQRLNLTAVGKWYVVEYDITVRSGALYITGYFSQTNQTTSGHKKFIIYATSGTFKPVVDSGDVDFDNISVRELPGNHATQTTTTSRPVLSARYNLLTKTEQFDDAAWVKIGVTVTPNAAVAPDGTTTADRIYPTLTGSARSLYQTVNAGNRLTVRAKAAGMSWLWFIDRAGGAGGAWFNLSTGAKGSVQAGHTSEIVPLGDGWYECSIQATTGVFVYAQIGVSDADNSLTATANGTNGVLLWGASLTPANQASLPYQRVNTATDYDADPSKFKPYLRFDGIDDSLQTNSIDFTATDAVTVFAGVRKLSDGGTLVELSTNAAINNGAFFAYAASSSTGTGPAYSFVSKGSTDARNAIAPNNYAAPVTNVFTGIGDIAGDSTILRLNGFQAASNTADQGTGNYGNYPLYIGRRGGTALPFNGLIYGLVIRGAASTTSQIQQTEAWLNQRTGAF